MIVLSSSGRLSWRKNWGWKSYSNEHFRVKQWSRYFQTERLPLFGLDGSLDWALLPAHHLARWDCNFQLFGLRVSRCSSFASASESILGVEPEGGRPVLSTKRQIAGGSLQMGARHRSRMRTCVKLRWFGYQGFARACPRNWQVPVWTVCRVVSLRTVTFVLVLS